MHEISQKAANDNELNDLQQGHKTRQCGRERYANTRRDRQEPTVRIREEESSGREEGQKEEEGRKSNCKLW